MNAIEQVKFIGKLKNELHNDDYVLEHIVYSGSRLYGWDSVDSDVDIRGMFSTNPRRILGLGNYKETVQLHKLCPNYDIVLHETEKYIRQAAVKNNCNFIEHFNAPTLYQTRDFKQLQSMINDSYGKGGLYNSYRGMAHQNYRKFILNGRNTVKKYLYVYRALLAGRYVMTTGKIEPNMEVLAKYFRNENIKVLLEIKRAGKENEPLSVLDSGELDLDIAEQFEKIDTAYLESDLPEKPDPDILQDIEKYLIDLRLSGLGL